VIDTVSKGLVKITLLFSLRQRSINCHKNRRRAFPAGPMSTGHPSRLRSCLEGPYGPYFHPMEKV